MWPLDGSIPNVSHHSQRLEVLGMTSPVSKVKCTFVLRGFLLLMRRERGSSHLDAALLESLVLLLKFGVRHNQRGRNLIEKTLRLREKSVQNRTRQTATPVPTQAALVWATLSS